MSALISQYDPKGGDQLFSLAPPSTGKRPSVDSNGANAFSTSISERLSAIHYTWIAELVESYPEQIRSYLIASLPKSTSEGVATLLGVEPKVSAPLIDRFFKQQIYLQLGANEILPEPLLPHSPLNQLLAFDKKELVGFISLLGVRDLATRLKTVVEQKTIAHFQRILSEERYRYLLSSMRQQDLFPAPRWELAGWQGGARELERLLQSRGLMRLGVALKEEEHSLVWHVVRRLDSGRGHQVLKEWKSQWEGAIRRAVHRQVADLLEFE